MLESESAGWISDLTFRRRQEVLESESAGWKAGLLLAVNLGNWLL